MSLEQVDQLINILYNERIKEQREEIERLRSYKFYCIYFERKDIGDKMCLGSVVCPESEIMLYVEWFLVESTLIRNLCGYYRDFKENIVRNEYHKCIIKSNDGIAYCIGVDEIPFDSMININLRQA